MGTRKRGRERGAGETVLSVFAHILCAVIVIFLFLTMTQCTIKKPEAPSWQTPLTIPLANKTWDMPELIEKIDQENLGLDSLGNPVFVYEGVLDTITIENSFVIPDVARTVAESLGIISLDPPNPAGVNINLGDYVSLVGGAVPPISFDIVELLPILSEYTEATVYRGREIITVRNDFGLTLDTVIVTLYDVGRDVVLSSYPIPGGLEPAEVFVRAVDLAGRTISNQFRLEVHCYTRGALSFSLANRTMEASVGMPDGLEVTAATAQIPGISKSFSQTVPFESDHEIHSAEMAGGYLVLDVANNSPLVVEMTITLPEFQSGGSSLAATLTVPAQEARQVSVPLAGYTLAPDDQSLPQSFVVDMSAGFNPTAPELAAVTADNNVAVTAAIRDVTLGEVDGVLASVQTEFTDIREDITIPEGCEGVTFQTGTLTIIIDNGINLPGSFSATVIGNGGQSRTIDGQVAAGTAENRVSSVVIDTGAAAFLNPVPNFITVSGTAVFTGGQASTTIHPSDYLVASIVLSSPLEFVIDSTVIDGGWEYTDLNLDTALVENLAGARLHARLTNRLPVGVSAEILLGPDSATLYTDPQVRLGPIVMSPGEIGPDGRVTEAVVSELVSSMDSTQLQVLQSDTLWIGELITLLGNGDQAVSLTATDSLTISGWLEIDVNFNDNLWED
jgi:hypothetical protein